MPTKTSRIRKHRQSKENKIEFCSDIFSVNTGTKPFGKLDMSLIPGPEALLRATRTPLYTLVNDTPPTTTPGAMQLIRYVRDTGVLSYYSSITDSQNFLNKHRALFCDSAGPRDTAAPASAAIVYMYECGA